jgi:hypothetical protein
MKRWQFTGVAFVAAALFFTARPAHAQVVFQRSVPVALGPAPIVPAPGPVWVSAPPVVAAPAPIVVSPGWGAVSPGWGARPYWRDRRAWRRAGWNGAVWGPRGGVVTVGRPVWW